MVKDTSQCSHWPDVVKTVTARTSRSKNWRRTDPRHQVRRRQFVMPDEKSVLDEVATLVVHAVEHMEEAPRS